LAPLLHVTLRWLLRMAGGRLLLVGVLRGAFAYTFALLHCDSCPAVSRALLRLRLLALQVLISVSLCLARLLRIGHRGTPTSFMARQLNGNPKYSHAQ
jgi:hypothetical protein